MTNKRTLALFLVLAISTMLSGILAIHTTAVFAQGNVTQAENQTGKKKEASRRQQIHQLLLQRLDGNQAHQDIKLSGI